MKNKLPLTTCAVFLIATLSGCSESATLGQGVNSINTMINDVTREIQEGLTGTSRTTQTQTTQTQTTQTTTQQAQQIIDWTPHLRFMQNACMFQTTTPEKIPNQYKPSIASAYKKDLGDSFLYTYNLQNATAFGYPLKKVEVLNGGEIGYMKLIFNDNSFTSIRSSFKSSTPDGYGTLERNDASGYDFYGEGFLYLKFDTNEHSITCGFGG